MESLLEQARAVSETQSKKRKAEAESEGTESENTNYEVCDRVIEYDPENPDNVVIKIPLGFKITLGKHQLKENFYRRKRLPIFDEEKGCYIKEKRWSHKHQTSLYIEDALKVRRRLDNNKFQVTDGYFTCSGYYRDFSQGTRWSPLWKDIDLDCVVEMSDVEALTCKLDIALRERDDALRQKAVAVSHAADAIREKDDVTCRLDNALGTKCEICDNENPRCFLGKICANDCKHKCCIMCLIDMGFNNHHSCPWCRGGLSSDALQDLRNLDRKLASPVYLSNPETPRNRVQDSLHFIMQGQLPELTPQQVSRRLDDLFAQAPTTVTEMFENALTPTPATPVANVSGSNTTVVNGTTYYLDG